MIFTTRGLKVEGGRHTQNLAKMGARESTRVETLLSALESGALVGLVLRRVVTSLNAVCEQD